MSTGTASWESPSSQGQAEATGTLSGSVEATIEACLAGVSISAPEALGEAEQFMKDLEAAGLALQQDATLVKAFQTIGVAGPGISDSLTALSEITSFNGPVGDIFAYMAEPAGDSEFFLAGLLNTLPFKFDQAIDVNSVLPDVADVLDPCGTTGIVKELGTAGDGICNFFDNAGNELKIAIEAIKDIVQSVKDTLGFIRSCVDSAPTFKEC